MIHSSTLRRKSVYAAAALCSWFICFSATTCWNGRTTAFSPQPLQPPLQPQRIRRIVPCTLDSIHDLSRQGPRFPFLWQLAAAANKKKKGTTTTTDTECSSWWDDDEIFSCLAAQGYREDPRLRIDRVMVAEIESLRDSFPSFENDGDTGSNMIKFSKRLRHPQQHRQHHPALIMAVPENDVDPRRYNEDPLLRNNNTSSTHVANMEYNRLVGPRELVLVDTTVRTDDHQHNHNNNNYSTTTTFRRALHRAGPRQLLHFAPPTVHAAIVTCGGLCPGLNNVIRELVHSLYYLYGVRQVWGVTGGFNGFLGKEGYDPILLTNSMVENIHHEGGTVLRSSRGGFEEAKILEFLREKKIDQLYVIGGDGTHRAAYKISQACRENKLNVAVAGIPKTIDNDVDYIDRSFGFVSAVEAAQNSIRTAKTEAQCNMPNGIGIIKLMGRSAGFLAAYAALGSGDVDCVLVPEVDIVLEGPDGILPFIRQRVKEQKYAVVVVAEGAGEELLGESTMTDAGGNKKLPPIGEFIRCRIEEYFAKLNEECTVKYIDPSYMVRSVPANAADSLYCMALAQNAVHGAMAGYTGFTTGLVNNRMVYLPIPQVVSASPRSLNPFGQTWERVLAMTGQPNTAVRPDDDDYSDIDVAVGQDGETIVEFPPRPEPSLH